MYEREYTYGDYLCGRLNIQIFIMDDTGNLVDISEDLFEMNHHYYGTYQQEF